MKLREFDQETRQTKNSVLIAWQYSPSSKSRKILVPLPLLFPLKEPDK